MKIYIKQILNKLFVGIALAMVLTASAFAQKPEQYTAIRGQFTESVRRQIPTQTLAKRDTVFKSGTVTSANSTNFLIGKNFALAKFDAAYIEADKEALGYTIVDLVYLIDELDGQPEAADLQKTLKAVVRGTSSSEQVIKDIETASKTYLARQTVAPKWYFNAGQTSINLKISTYLNEDAKIKKGLSDLQTLIKIAPQGIPKEIIDPMNVLAKYVAKTAFTEADYTAIFQGAGSVIDAVA